MVLRMAGTGLMARLMQARNEDRIDTAWLLFGPTDPDVVEPDASDLEDWLLAAE